MKYKQFCVPRKLCREVVFCVHNSKSLRTFWHRQNGRKISQTYLLSNFYGIFNFYNQNCLTCSQLKRASSKYLKLPLQPLWLISYPNETLQFDLVDPLKSPVQRFVLTATNVQNKYLFAVPMKNVRADTIVR